MVSDKADENTNLSNTFVYKWSETHLLLRLHTNNGVFFCKMTPEQASILAEQLLDPQPKP